MFSKKKSSTPSLVNASAYLAAVADRDRRAQSVPSSAASMISTPALSLSSSLTGDSSPDEKATSRAGGRYFDMDLDLDADNDETGLLRPAVPPTSEEVFSTRHVEFGHDAHAEYRYTHEFSSEKRFEQAKEEEPPYYILLTTYLSYLIFIVIGHTRDFFGMRISPQKYKHLMPNNGMAALTSDFDSFYTRRIKKRIEDLFARPVTGVAGRTIVLLDRQSPDYNHSFQLTGTRTRALNVSSYNYLGFAQARGGCADAVEQGIRKYGLSSCGSRLEGGTTDLHVQAEALVATFIGAEDALITSMGFATNSTTIPAIVAKGSLIISDELNHASIRVGVRFGGAAVRTFKHNDVKDLEKVLREAISQGQPRTHRPWKKIILIVEGLYSMEGTLVDLPSILKLKERYKFYLYVDEAHSVGAMGANGRGVIDYFGINPCHVDIFMGTFTKSFGASGGYIAGSKELISRLRVSTHAGPYAESMSPAVLTQIIASMSSIMGVSTEPTVGPFPSLAPRSMIPTWLYDQLTPALRDGSEGKERSRRLAFNSRYLSLGLVKLGFIVYGHPDSPIIPLLVFNPGKLSAFSRMMLERKTPIIVVAVGYPATSLVAARMRFCLSAAHTKEDVDTLLKACEEIGTVLDLKHGIPAAERWTLEEVMERSVELVNQR
ncbi:serine palmitoyltransferase component [Tulasnella sp. JGI-2019a]|nr:serine palmitoyltransferase component [Tulasnella sp. JGI-2019a]KAG9011407.1 serine palmitoyltransferase component [Tulasnella sp. JGI-2019a]